MDVDVPVIFGRSRRGRIRPRDRSSDGEQVAGASSSQTGDVWLDERATYALEQFRVFGVHYSLLVHPDLVLLADTLRHASVQRRGANARNEIQGQVSWSGFFPWGPVL